jgi:hypothetical protein
VSRDALGTLGQFPCQQGELWRVDVGHSHPGSTPRGTSSGVALVAVGVVVALSAVVLLSGSGRFREVAGRSLMTTGFNSLALPIAALIAFLVGGAQLPAGSARAELSAVILGVRLAGNVATVGLSVGGLLAGVFLVFLGDRLLRQARQTLTAWPGPPRLRASAPSRRARASVDRR